MILFLLSLFSTLRSVAIALTIQHTFGDYRKQLGHSPGVKRSSPRNISIFPGFSIYFIYTKWILATSVSSPLPNRTTFFKQASQS